MEAKRKIMKYLIEKIMNNLVFKQCFKNIYIHKKINIKIKYLANKGG